MFQVTYFMAKINTFPFKMNKFKENFPLFVHVNNEPIKNCLHLP